jgi:signal transduction histidine kinase
VHHVSYELRSPLTTIIGFAQLLDDPVIGPLNTKQREYVGHITESSTALLAIINDILDLATIDAGAMQLEIADVDVHETMQAAAEGIRDRLAEQNLKLDIRVRPDIGALRADGKRGRSCQSASAVGPRGETITLAVEWRARLSSTTRGWRARITEHVLAASTPRPKHRVAWLSIARSFALHGGSVDRQCTWRRVMT